MTVFHGIPREEAIAREIEVTDNSELGVMSSTMSDGVLLSILATCSQNSLCFYPNKLLYDEAIKRGLDIKNIVSDLPLLVKEAFYVPRGMQLWWSGKKFDDVKLSTDDDYFEEKHHINQDRKLKLMQGYCTKEEMPQIPDLSSLSDNSIKNFIKKSSQNELSFFPNRCYVEEALKRGFYIQELFSELPLLTAGKLWIPEGIELWSNGSIYREI